MALDVVYPARQRIRDLEMPTGADLKTAAGFKKVMRWMPWKSATYVHGGR
jgi:hypothetical protein